MYVKLGMKCAPSLKVVKNIIDKKDSEIYDLYHRIRKYDAESKMIEEMKKQINSLKKQNDDYKRQLKFSTQELTVLKRNNEKVVTSYDQLSEDVKPKQELTRDLRSLLTTQDHYDCIISCAGQKYQAHRCILSIRSKTFADMIADVTRPSDPKAKSKSSSMSNAFSGGIINLAINDVNPDMVPFLLNYLYTANTDGITDQNVPEVMKLADKFELASLRSSCLLFMENRINRGTVVPILIEAYELNHERLKNKCMRYIQEENIDLVASPQWNNFKTENPKLALSLYERYIKEMGATSYRRDKNFEETNNQYTSRSTMPTNNLNKGLTSNSYMSNSNSNLYPIDSKINNGGYRNIVIDRKIN